MVIFYFLNKIDIQLNILVMVKICFKKLIVIFISFSEVQYENLSVIRIGKFIYDV